MTESLAIVDTDVAILLLDTRKHLDDATYKRRERATAAIGDLRARGARCLITTPTVVELAAWPGGPKQALPKLRQFLAGLRVCGLTVGSARSAGEILHGKLKQRPAGKSRNEIKFDALIAAIAHASDARWLITGNAKDYRPLLKHINSQVQLVDIDALSVTRRQMSLAEQQLPPPGDE